MDDLGLDNHLELRDTLARLGGDRDLLGELYAAFSEDVPKKVQSLAVAVKDGDLVKVMKSAHSLKGSAGAVGAVGCRDLAIKIEAMAKEGNLQEVETLLEVLKKEMRTVLQLIERQL